MSRMLLQRGHSVYIIDVNDEELAHTVNVHLKDYPKRFSAICDVTNVDQVRLVAEDAVRKLGIVDCLVNDAAIARPTMANPMTDYSTWDEYNKFIQVNLISAFTVSQAFASKMAKDGAIVHISSTRWQQSQADWYVHPFVVSPSNVK